MFYDCYSFTPKGEWKYNMPIKHVYVFGYFNNYKTYPFKNNDIAIDKSQNCTLFNNKNVVFIVKKAVVVNNMPLGMLYTCLKGTCGSNKVWGARRTV
jgi:hypothetical protein